MKRIPENPFYLLSSSKMSVSLLITEKILWLSCGHVCVCLRKKPTEGRVYFLSWPQFLSVTRLQTSSVVYFLVIKVDETGHVYGQLKTVPGSYTSFFHKSILGVDSKYYFRQRYDFIPVSKSLESDRRTACLSKIWSYFNVLVEKFDFKFKIWLK